MIRATVPALAALAPQDRQHIADLPRDIAAHDAHMAGLACMTTIEVGGRASLSRLAFPLTLAAWNLERCLFPDASAAKIAQTGASVVLLSEMDKGMARTGQANTTAEVARPLGMAYAYGVEFIELGLGSDTERAFCRDDFNAMGFHGNAIAARVPLGAPFMVRLEGRRRWFTEGGDQPRMGERMAIGAVIDTTDGPFVAISTHFESNAGVADREAQFTGLVDALEGAFPGMALVIGGDLNTGNHIPGDWRDETLFACARARGFACHGGALDALSTRPSLITRWPDRAMKLDWFVTRGVQVAQSWLVPSLGPDGTPLSDHDLIAITLSGLAPAG